MTQRVIENVDELKALVGQQVVVTDYMTVNQERIDQFADTTEDWQWIHVDADRAKKESPYGTTIAHGFLTLSLLVPLMASAVRVSGVLMGVNYGLDRVRFPAAVPAGSKIHARVNLQSVEDIKDGVQAKWNVAIECEGATKPCCVAEWIGRYYTSINDDE